MSESSPGQRVYRVNLKDIIQDCALDSGLDPETVSLIDAEPVDDTKHEAMLQLAEVDDA